MKGWIREIVVTGHPEAPEFIGCLEARGTVIVRGEATDFHFLSDVEIGENPHSHESLSLGPTAEARLTVSAYRRLLARLKELVWGPLRPGDEVGAVLAGFPGPTCEEGSSISTQVSIPFDVR